MAATAGHTEQLVIIAEAVGVSYMNNLENVDVANEASRRNRSPKFIHSCRTASLAANLVKVVHIHPHPWHTLPHFLPPLQAGHS